MTTQTAPITSDIVPQGTWRVESGAGSVEFHVRAMWGLAKVRGTFARYRGTVVAEPQGMAGELVIETASLDTKNSMRDRHLRSSDFFDAERHAEIVFTTNAITARDRGLTVSGDLRIGATSLRLHLPVDVERRGDRVRLRATTSVPRERAGLAWNKLGTIRGEARLTVDLELTRQV